MIVLDISASVNNRQPDYDLIRVFGYCMPNALVLRRRRFYVSQLERIVGLGVEKVAVSNILYTNPDFVHQASCRVGSQSVVAVLDVVRTGILHKNYSLSS